MELVEVLRAEPWLFAAAAGLFGLLGGSFLNVVIHRLPTIMEREWRADCASLDAAPDAPEPAPQPRYNLVVPRSACPGCGAPITALQNIPIVSWLVLRGRCASCRQPISVRYPLIELATGVLSALVAWHFGWGWESLCAIPITWLLIALTAIDIDTKYIYDSMTLPLLWAGLIAAAYLGRGTATIPVDLKSAVLGAVFGYLSLWSVFHLFRLVTGKEGMGYGDFKLFGALGAWMGWQMLLPIILFSAVTGSVLGIVLIATGQRARQAEIPFGPYLAASGWLVMMWAPALVAPWWPLGR